MAVVSIVSCYISRVFLFVFYTQNSPPTPGWFGVSWPVGTPYVNAQTARTEVGRPPRWMPFLSRERFIPAAAADAVTPTYLRATVADFHPTYSIRTSVAVPSMLWLAAPPARKECIVYHLILHTRRPQMGLEVGGHLSIVIRILIQHEYFHRAVCK